MLNLETKDGQCVYDLILRWLKGKDHIRNRVQMYVIETQSLLLSFMIFMKQHVQSRCTVQACCLVLVFICFPAPLSLDLTFFLGTKLQSVTLAIMICSMPEGCCCKMLSPDKVESFLGMVMREQFN